MREPDDDAVRLPLFYSEEEEINLSECRTDSFRHCRKLLVGQLQFRIGKKHIFFVLHRNQMYVRMGHFKSQHRFTYFLAWESPTDGRCHSLGKHVHCRQIFVGQVEDIIHFLFGNNQCMPLHQRVDIKKSKEPGIFRHLIARYFTCDNSTEYCCHSCMYKIRQVRIRTCLSIKKKCLLLPS